MKRLVSMRNRISTHERSLAYAIALATVLLCWALIWSAGNEIKSLDEPDFLLLSQNLAFEGQFVGENDYRAYRAPGFVFFLAPFVKLGAELMELRLINAVLVGASMILLFHITARNAGPLAGLISVALAPFWPVVLYAATTLYPQTLAAFLLLLTIWLLDHFRENRSWTYCALAGLSCGALLLTVPIILLLLPIFIVWVGVWATRKFAYIVLFCVMVFGVVGSWTTRNYLVLDAFVPVATSSGFNLIAGNSPETRYNTSLDIRFPEYVYTELTGKNEVDRNKVMTSAAIAEIKENPGRTIRLYIGKFIHWFDYSNTLLSDTAVEGGAQALGVNKREVILFTTYLLIILPLLTHIALQRRYPFKPVEILGLCLWVGAGLAYAIFFTRIRFRLPFDWMIFASNGIFLAALFDHYAGSWKERTRSLTKS